ncbi:hypothetical protein DPEC_G00317770 [Dallia pectoralis]|uniref:Uncharacterized protein n=1 Tax=Dallia pectoralis TaxID=75939 RepID=A0ACC2FCW9_DALPE|nr:hypothetical protein DPEC_G00317770 [Dallia pectoralis]
MMSTRRQQHSGNPDDSLVRSCPGSLDKLAFKYMDMCKVVSSTESESDVSPLWSDTSTMGCVSSAESCRPLRKTLTCSHKPIGRYLHHSTSVDPYDGSSEDSDESMCGPGRVRQSNCRHWGRTQKRPVHHPAVNLQEVIRSGGLSPGPTELHLVDVQMRSMSDSERWTCNNLDSPLPWNHLRWEGPVAETPPDVAAETSARAVQMPGRCSESPAPLSLFKRKLSLPGVEIVEAETLQEFSHRKRQCYTKMETAGSSPDNRLLTR